MKGRGVEGSSSVDASERLGAALFGLLDATESLLSSLADGTPVEVWEERWAHREAAYREVERAAAVSAGERPAIGAVARTCLERIAELDGAILRAGGEGLARLQQERIALGSRRRAVLAHGLQPRETPRAITVKA
jgi:hypothetical protein